MSRPSRPELRQADSIFSQREGTSAEDAAPPPLALSEAELSAAFEFFDVDGKGKLTAADLKARLGVFYRNLPPKACRGTW